MAVIDKPLNQAPGKADRALALEEMIRRQTALLQEDHAFEDDFLEEDYYDEDAQEGRSSSGRQRVDPRSRQGKSPVSGNDEHSRHPGDSRGELLETLRQVEGKHRKVAQLAMIGRCLGPLVVVAFSLLMMGTNAREVVVVLAIIAAAALVVVADSLVRKWGNEAHRRINQQTWAVQRELNRRASRDSDL